MEWLAETVAQWGRPHTMLLKDRTLGGAAQEDICRQGTDADGITATGYGGSALTVWGSTGRGHGGTVCAQADGQMVPRGEGTRILWRRQHRGGLPGSAGQAKCAVPSGGGLTVLQGVTSC